MKVLEKHVQKAILQYLNIRGYVCKRNNAGMGRANYNGKERFFLIGESGWPDIEGLTKEGRYFGIEVKSKAGTLSESQKRMQQRIIDTKGIYFVARSVDDVIAAGF